MIASTPIVTRVDYKLMLYNMLIYPHSAFEISTLLSNFALDFRKENRHINQERY